MSELRIAALGIVETVAAKTGIRVNRLAPVDRLTDDTLTLIMLHLDNRTLSYTRQVSWRWRNLALSTPSLWTNIDMSCRPHYDFQNRFQLFAERSQNAHLDLKLVMEGDDSDTYDTHIRDDEVDMVYMWSHRCAYYVEHQLGCVEELALAPDVITRLRTLDLTSTILNGPPDDEYDLEEQLTPTLHLPACSSLRRLRLNWAKPDVHKLQLDLDPQSGAYDSVDSLALCAIINLENILPRFPGVIDLSLWLGNLAHKPNYFQLADIFAWMPQLRKLEVAEIPKNFVSRTLTSPPSLDRLRLHGRFALDSLATISSQIDLDAISEISLWNFKKQAFKSVIIPVSSGPTAELSVYSYIRQDWPRTGVNYCADDGRGHRRLLHNTKCHSEYDAEIVSYAIINTNANALYCIIPNTIPMPKLVTLRVCEPKSSLLSYTGRVPQISCPALANLELYVAEPDVRGRNAKEMTVSGAVILEWVEGHLKDFARPLDTLRLVGVGVGSDLDALDGLARNVFFTPSLLVGYVSRHLCCRCSQDPTENVHGLVRHCLPSCSRNCKLDP